MKKQNIIFCAVFGLIILLASCKNNSSNSAPAPASTEAAVIDTLGSKQAIAVMYQCPMKCEGEKTYDKAGKCPKCNMDLKAVENHEGHNHEGHNH